MYSHVHSVTALVSSDGRTGSAVVFVTEVTNTENIYDRHAGPLPVGDGLLVI